MTGMEVLAFIITPLMGLALAWGLALYVERVDGRAGPSER